jgi:membrane-associated protein
MTLRQWGVFSIEQAILNWLDSNGQFAIILIPALAFAEACLGIGLLISGVFLLLVATTVYANQLAGIEVIIALACVGAILGDHVGFHIGRWLGPGFHHTRAAERYRDHLQKGEAVIRRYGAAAIFVGRFVPAIRSLIPAMLGLSGFNSARYSVLDILACVLWSSALGAIVLGLDLGLSAGQ